MNEVALIYQFMISQGCHSDSPVMVDVGAHYGSSFRKFAEAGWNVFALEPDPENRKTLKRKNNNFANVNIDHRAIAAKSHEQLPFYQSRISSGISGLHSFHESHTSNFSVETVTFHDFCKEKSIEDIDFLKIDTEGYDLFVLESNNWNAIRPKIIICEFENSKTIPLGYRFRDLTNFLMGQGYFLFISEWHPIVEYGKAHRWRSLKEYPCNLDDNNSWGNIIALRDPERVADFKLAADVFIGQQKIINRQQKLLEEKDFRTKEKEEKSHIKDVITFSKRYSAFTEWLKVKSPVLFFVGQRIMRVLRARVLKPRVSLARVIKTNVEGEKRQPKFFYYPFFTSTSDLNDHIARACWYLSIVDFHAIYFVCDEQLDLSSYRFEVPDYLDANLVRIYEKIKEKIIFLKASEKAKVVNYFDAAENIVHWDCTSHPDSLWKQKFEVEAINKKKWQVDTVNERFAGSLYIKAGMHSDNFPDKAVHVEDCRNKFREFITKTGQHEKAYVFGTGPLIDKYRNFDFTKGLKIICNSIIFDDEMLSFIRPDVLVFGDPVFHFGCNLYAREYREKLLEVAIKYDLSVIVPLNYYRIFIHHFSELKERCIGVPLENGKGTNLNLEHQFYVESTSNILTLLLLPLACTFAREINIFGCDGRKLKDNKYYWSHHNRTQIGSKMSNAQKAHPGFFNIDYNKYHKEHCEALEKWICVGESSGKSFKVRTPSYIPALRKRYVYVESDYEHDFYPSLAIIIPYKNAGETIHDAVMSIFQDGYPRISIIIVNNGSDQANTEIVADLACSDSRIELIHSDKEGVSNARNTGMLAAKTDYLGFLDADDTFCKESVFFRMQRLIDYDHDAVYCPTEIVDENRDHLSWITSGNRENVTFLQMEGAPFHANSLFIKRCLIPNFGLFDSEISNGEDWDFFQLLARCGVVFWNVPEGKVQYVQHSKGTVFSDYNKHLMGLNDVLTKVYTYDDCGGYALEEYKDGFGAAHMRYRANKRLWQGVLWNTLSGQDSAAKEISEAMWPHLTESMTCREIEEMSRWLIARFYQCDVTQWRDMLKGQMSCFVERLCSNFDETKTSTIISKMRTVFSKLSIREETSLQNLREDYILKEKINDLDKKESLLIKKDQELARRNHLLKEKENALKCCDIEIAHKNNVLLQQDTLIKEMHDLLDEKGQTDDIRRVLNKAKPFLH